MRDPKTTPMPGDSLRKGRVRKVVTKISEPFMYWKSWVGRGEGPETCGYISTWRRWSGTAVILRRGDDGIAGGSA